MKFHLGADEGMCTLPPDVPVQERVVPSDGDAWVKYCSCGIACLQLQQPIGGFRAGSSPARPEEI